MEPPVIQVERLCKDYGTHRALDGLTFAVASGGVVGFLGANGAGKSTTMRILTGFLPATSGTARVCGLDVAADSLRVRSRIGYLPENNPLYPELRVGEYLAFRARLKRLPRGERARAIDAAVANCGLEDVRTRIVGQLSKGYRQRVGLADCLLTDAPLLILDEPTVGLDPNQARETRALISRIGETRTVFLSTHVLSDVEALCREVVIIHRGALLAVDTPAALCGRSDAPRRYRVEVGGEPSDVLPILRSVPEVASAEVQEGGVGSTVYVLDARAGSDPRPGVMAACAAAARPVLQIQTEPVRLEDIFAELTEAAS